MATFAPPERSRWRDDHCAGTMARMADDGLAQVSDLLAIRRLCERYAQAVDAGDKAAFVSVFTADGHLTSNFTGSVTHYRGPEQLARIVDGAKEIAPKTMHFLGNHIADVDGDVASGLTYCMAHHLRDDRTNLLMMVRYRDRYARSPDGEWLITQRDVLVDWTETRQADLSR
jgi:uncharacterized protein (TIGR02246 family)